MKHYLQNLEKLKQHLPDLPKLPDICESRNITPKEALHSLKEIQKNNHVICIYGIGSGSDYFKLKQWLQEEENQFLVFLEDDLQALCLFLHQKHASKILDDPKVRFYYLESPLAIEVCLKKIAWEFVLLNFQLFIHPDYLEKKQTQTLKRFFHKICLGCSLVASDYSDMGVQVIKNSLKNLKDLPKLFVLPKKAPFSNVPAIICGAGSSIETIKEKLFFLKDRFLLFSGGAGLSLLSNENIVPHFGAILDKKSILESFIRQNAFQVPLFFQKRASHDCMQLVHGEKMLVLDSFGYLYEKWIDNQWIDNQWIKNQLKAVQEIEAGWNVATFVLQMALFLGCNPIIFAGVDLCLKNKHFYASGVDRSALQMKEESELIEVKDSKQKTTLTQPDWYLAAKYIQELTSKHQDRSFFSLSDGLDLGQSVQPITLEKLADFPTLDLDGLVHGFLQEEGFISLQTQKTQKIMDQTKRQLQQSLNNLENLLIKLEKLYNQGILEEQFEESLQDPWAIEYLFFPLWNMLKSMFQRADLFSYPTLQKTIFLKDVIESHLKMLQKI